MENKDFTEIVFNNRNKDYGAYYLRKNYKKVVIISTIISIICCSSVVIIPYFTNLAKIYRDGIPGGYNYLELTSEHLDFPKDKISSVQSIEMMSIMPVFINDISSKSLNNGKEDDQIYPYDEKDNSSPNGQLESRPTFLGGDIKTFINWVVTHIEYPEEARKTKTQGSFKAIFVIEKDGSVSNIKVESDVDKSIDKEIKRVISSSPKWSPGIISGRPVRVRCEFPLIFTIK